MIERIETPENIKEIADKMNKNIYEEIEKLNSEVKERLIINRYNELRLSFWKRFWFLFAGV